MLEDADDKQVRDAYAKQGFVHIPSSGAPGGVIATGGIRRDATLGLAALRLLAAGQDADSTLALRRYVLGLALAAFTHSSTGYLRQGCNLVLNPDQPREFVEVFGDGRREKSTLTHAAALDYARGVAELVRVRKTLKSHDFSYPKT